MPEKLLSTDPKAGQLLSADPKAGQVATAPPAAPPVAAPQPQTLAERVRASIPEVEAAETARSKQNANILPAVAGLVGGVMGGPVGAALGGVAGEAGRQAVLRGQNDPSAPATLTDQAREMGQAGAVQGAMQLGGDALMKGGTVLAKWLMNRATTRVTEKLMRDFPNLSDTLIDNALTVSKGGYEKARGLLLTAKAHATTALAKAERAGATVPLEFTTDIAESFKTALIEQAVKGGQTALAAGQTVTMATSRLPKAVQSLIAQVDAAVQGGQPFNLTPKHADLLKGQLQKESRALYANRNAPNGPRAMDAEATLKAELASRLNDALDGVAVGYKAANAQAQKFIGATRGLQQATRPNGNLYQAMVRPAVGAALGGAAGEHHSGNATAGAVAGAALASPSNMSRIAIMLGNPVVKEFIGQLPRGIAAAIEAQLRQESAPAPVGTPPPR